MISEIGAAVLCFGLGILFDALTQAIIRSQRDVPTRSAGLVFVNNGLWFLVVALTYFVDGFTVHGEWGEGWFDWTTLTQNFAAAYAWITVASVWRLLFGRSEE